jgi:hypothetical protein
MLMIEALSSSEMSVLTRATRRNIPKKSFFIVTAVKTPSPTKCIQSALNTLWSVEYSNVLHHFDTTHTCAHKTHAVTFQHLITWHLTSLEIYKNNSTGSNLYNLPASHIKIQGKTKTWRTDINVTRNEFYQQENCFDVSAIIKSNNVALSFFIGGWNLQTDRAGAQNHLM